MATGTVSDPLPLPALLSGPQGRCPGPFHVLPFTHPSFSSSMVSGPCSPFPGWERPQGGKMKC